jgi:hypothetical protein
VHFGLLGALALLLSLPGDAPPQHLAGEQRRLLRSQRLSMLHSRPGVVSAGWRERPAGAPPAPGSPCAAAAAAARRPGAPPPPPRPPPRRRGRGARPRAVPAGASRGTRGAACGRLGPCACTTHRLVRGCGRQARSPVSTDRPAPVQGWRPRSHRLRGLVLGRGALPCQQRPWVDISLHSTGPQAPGCVGWRPDRGGSGKTGHIPSSGALRESRKVGKTPQLCCS